MAPNDTGNILDFQAAAADKKAQQAALAERKLKKIQKKIQEALVVAVPFSAFHSLIPTALDQKNTEDLDKCVASGSKDPQAWERLGAAYSELGNMSAALWAYQTSVDSGTVNPRVFKKMGEIQSNKEDFKGALKSYKQAFKLNSQDIEVLSQLSSIYLLQNDNVNAWKFCKKVLEIDSTNYIALTNMAVISTAVENFDEAIEACKGALISKPNSTKAHLNLARAYKASGLLDDALNEVSEAKKTAYSDDDKRSCQGLIRELKEAARKLSDQENNAQQQPRIIEFF